MSTKRTLGWTAAALVAASLLYAERDGIRSRLPAPTGPRIRTTYRYFAYVYNALVDFFLFGQEGPIRRWVVALAKLQPGDTVLDLACGTGRISPIFWTASGQKDG